MDIKSSVSSLFLFRGMSEGEISECLCACELTVKEYEKGEVIYSKSDFEKKLGLVISGECCVERPRGSGNPLPLNTLSDGDTFGILAAFTGKDEFPTLIIAKKRTSVVYISRSELIRMMEISSLVSLNIISFLANRIEFLCDKISAFSSDNAEQKLAQYLLLLYQKSGCRELKFNKKHAAESLNTGRTSLYRSLEKLEERGIIKTEEKTIIIIDPEGLERISK